MGVQVPPRTRDGRRRLQGSTSYAVPGSLIVLHGPASGLVELPMSIAWTGRREYDLGAPADVAVMYERVLVEAPNVETLAALLEVHHLRAVWRRLYLPAPVRRLWEAQLPQLASAA